jgi:hypothetical protein
MNTTTLLTRRAPIAMLGALALSCAVGVAGFSAVLPAGKVKPNLEFGGVVNGAAPTAAVHVVCPSGATTGHPAAGQTLAVFRPEVLRVDGFTGTQARMIIASFSDDPSAPVVFRQFGIRKAVPTSLTLPCSGSGTVVFAPVRSSSTAQAARVAVAYGP